MEQKLFMRAPEIMEVLGVSDGMAYRIIRELNQELEAKGFHTVRGRVSRKFFEESYYGVIHEKEEV